MKSEKLTELIRHPENIGAEDLRELDILVNRYPYFQAARILYLKALYMQAGARFRNELKMSTVHITDHKQLYRYLNGQLEFESLSPQAGRSALLDVVDERIREIKGHTVVTSYGIPAYPQEITLEENAEEIVSFNLKPAPPENEASKNISRPAVTEANIVSNPIILDDMPGVIEDYAEEEEDRLSGQATTVFRPIPPSTQTSNPLPDLSSVPGMIDEPEQKIPEQPTVRVSSPTLSLDIDLETEEEREVKPTPPDKPAALETPEILSGAYRMTEDIPLRKEELPDTGTSDSPKRKNKKKKDELIERFIQSEPGMPKITASTTDNRDLSKENPYAQEELFSETLAKIYVRQHLYEKAIATYIKLSLKYPEKSVYFANRIENIKLKLNNNE